MMVSFKITTKVATSKVAMMTRSRPRVLTSGSADAVAVMRAASDSCPHLIGSRPRRRVSRLDRENRPNSSVPVRDSRLSGYGSPPTAVNWI